MCAWETFGRGSGSEALMDGAVLGTGVEREAAALTGELVPFQAMGTVSLEITEVGWRTRAFSEDVSDG